MTNDAGKVKLIIELDKSTYEFIRDLRYLYGGSRSCKTIQLNVINAIKDGKPYINLAECPKKKDSHYDYWHRIGTAIESEEPNEQKDEN